MALKEILIGNSFPSSNPMWVPDDDVLQAVAAAAPSGGGYGAAGGGYGAGAARDRDRDREREHERERERERERSEAQRRGGQVDRAATQATATTGGKPATKGITGEEGTPRV